jgi:hypothetical protein
MAVISKGIQLYCESFEGNTFEGATTDETYGILLPGLQEVGALSGLKTTSERDKIEVTTLADDKHVYAEGILVDSEMETIDFKFLYDKDVFEFLRVEANAMADSVNGEKVKWTVRIPVAYSETGAPTYATFQMHADITSLKMDGASVNSALTMSLTLKPVEAITIA